MRHVPGVGAVAPVGTGYPPPKTTLSATWLVKATLELQVPEAAAGVGHNMTVREAAARAARKRMFTVPTSAPMAPRTRLVVQPIIASRGFRLGRQDQLLYGGGDPALEVIWGPAAVSHQLA